MARFSCKKIELFIEQKLPMKLRQKLFLIYLIGGAIPMIITSIYLMNDTRQILIQQAKDAEVAELQVVERQLQETISTVATVSKYFYFDEALEQIAARPYENYQQIVDDYRSYTAFDTYSGYYNRTLRWISIYMENPTLVGNSRFVAVDEEVRERKWYQQALHSGGAVVWQYIPMETGSSSYLSLTRLIQTEKNENVGVLVESVRPERLSEILTGRRSSTTLLLNGRETLVLSGEPIPDGLAAAYLPEETGGVLCQNVSWEGKKYLLTCIDLPLEESRDMIRIVGLCAYADILQDANQQGRTSILFFVVSLGISMAVILYFSRSFAGRVERFRGQMQKAASGNFSLIEHLGGQDEISDLYEYLNTMIWSIQRLLAEVYHEQMQKEKLKTRQKDAEFKMLASQINPHFLYNTLETIRMKARANGQTEIEELVKMLAKIMRRNIQSGNQTVTLQSEVTLLEYYLRIQQYRFGDRIRYHIEIQPGLEECRILPLLMQPFVENAVVHGLECKEGGGNIYITAVRSGGDLLMTIEDDGMGMPEETLRALMRNMEDFENMDRTHIGIANVHQRIRLKYGDRYGVTIRSIQGQMTRAQLRVPIEDETEKDTDADI